MFSKNCLAEVTLYGEYGFSTGLSAPFWFLKEKILFFFPKICFDPKLVEINLFSGAHDSVPEFFSWRIGTSYFFSGGS